MTRQYERERLDAIEETQASLRSDIEASKRLIRRSEDLIDSCRGLRPPQTPEGARPEA